MNNSANPTYLALGDSYTIGESVLPTDRWPVMLSESLDWMTPHIVAKTGWTTAELLDGISQENLAPAYDWISLLIGVNNQYRSQSVNDYVADLEQFAELMLPLVNHNSKHIFLLSIPDYSVTPFAQDKDQDKISREIKLYNEANEAFAKQHGFQYCDITGHSLLAKEHPDYLAADQLHPSGLMYELWVKEVLECCKFS